MTSRNLFRAALRAHLVSLMLLTFLTALAFSLSLRRSVDIWNVNRGQRLENLMLPALASVYRQTGTLDGAMIHERLRAMLTSNMYAFVFDPQGRPVYVYTLGRRVPLYEREEISRELARRSSPRRPRTPVLDGIEIVGYLSADTVGFAHDAANRRFITNVTTTVAIGMIAAILVALAAAWRFASRLAGQTRTVAAGIARIASGERDVQFGRAQIAELHEIVTSVERLQHQLRDEQLLRRRWMEDIAHDLRTPITALKTQLEGISDGYLEVDPARIRDLYLQVCQVEWLVSDLRELSLMESPETEIRLEPVDLCELVHASGESLRAAAERAGAELRTTCTMPTHVQADPHLLHRAVTNVVKNACEHVAPSGEVCVRVARSGDYAVVEVSNSGTVDPAEIPRFFERFYRGEDSQERPGSGLGLPIARTIAERHGGTITMQPDGDRTTVTIYVPLPV